MKLKLRNIINIQSSYSKLLEQQFLPIKLRYTLSKDGRTITNEIEEYGKLRNDLAKKYEITEKTLVNSPEAQSWQLEVDDLLDIEMDLLTEPFDIELLLTDECNLSAKELLQLDFMTKEVEKVVDKVEEKKDDVVSDKK